LHFIAMLYQTSEELQNVQIPCRAECIPNTT
jgi:hypothetical protein